MLVTPAWQVETRECPGCRRIADAGEQIPESERSWRHVVLTPTPDPVDVAASSTPPLDDADDHGMTGGVG